VIFCITNRCSRKCKYCSEKTWFLQDEMRPAQDMSVTLIEEIFRRSKVRTVGLCGGEPLLHPQIFDILESCRKFKVKPTIYSNLEVDEQICSTIATKYKDVVDRWHINIDYSDDKYKLFTKNFFTYILNNNSFELEAVLTPFEELQKKTIERLDRFYSNFAGDYKPSLELAFMMPIPSQEFMVYNYTNFLDELIPPFKEKHNVEISIDQVVMGCEVDHSLREDKKMIEHFSLSKSCRDGEYYVMPDRSVLKCLAAPDVRLPDVLRYGKKAGGGDPEKDIVFEMRRRQKDIVISINCRKCPSLNPSICMGLCYAKYRNINMER